MKSMPSSRGKELEQALGHLVFEFGRLETALGCAVGYLVNPRNSGVAHILVGELSFRARMAAFSALYSERLPGGTDKASLDSFVSGACRADEERNRLIHSFYRHGPVGGSSATRIKTTAKGKNGLRIQFETVTAASIAEAAEEAARAKGLLYGLMVRFPDYTRYSAGFFSFFKDEKSSSFLLQPTAAPPRS